MRIVRRAAIGDTARVRNIERRRLRQAADIAVPLVVALFLMALVEDATGLSAIETLLGMLAGAIQGAALWWRRSHPQVVMAIALAGGLVIWALAPDGMFPFAGLVAIFALAAARPPRVSLLALAALAALTALNYLTAAQDDATFVMIFPVVAWALGEAARSRRAAIGEASRRAVGEEQARIARELHDVIAHSVSVIVVQAAAADDVFDEHPDQARRALRSIEGAGREALVELRRLLVAVGSDGDDGDPLRPHPGLDRLDELAGSLRAAGLDVVVRDDRTAAPTLPVGVDLCAYRILQEALTNTLRHASARRVDVSVRAADGVLELEIRDDGRGAPAGQANDSGRGITGMRERATMLGGTFEARSTPGGGFRVRARLPLDESGARR
ncbi:MAG: sensor histidine kinase [Solirubrobacteraceae bacterium]|nr:sensor histidine kinase [Solirubrobacteraceae bacterium]